MKGGNTNETGMEETTDKPLVLAGLVGVVLTATGANPEMLTSWQVLCDEVKALFANPYLLATAFLAVLGVLTDPTTKGISDEKKN